LISVSPFMESTSALDTSILGSFGQAARTSMRVEIANKDRNMSRLLGEECIIRQRLFALIGFSYAVGYAYNYMQLRFSGTIVRVNLNSNVCSIEAEQLL